MGYIILAVAILLSIILLKKKVNLGIVMLVNCVFIVVGTKMSGSDIALSLKQGFLSSKTIGMLLVLILILMIEHIMRTTNMINNLVSALRSLMNNSKYSAVVLPIVIGMLPSPGGAVFSCPMVDATLGDKIPADKKAFINYYFRHTWLEGFILYPAIILLSELVGVSVLAMSMRLVPFMIIWLISGLIRTYRGTPKEDFILENNDDKHINQSKASKYKALLKASYPIIVVIGLYMLLISVTNVPYDLQIAAISTIIVLIIVKKFNLKQIGQVIKKSFNIKYILLITGVMVFNEFLSASGIIEILLGYIYDNNIPIALVYIIIPMTAAIFAGVAVNFVSLAFPILILMGLGNNLFDVIAAFVCGVVGAMCTPLHLCSVMSAEYFKTPITKLLKDVAFSALPVLIIAILVIVF